MHTAFSLADSMFDIQIDGKAADRAALLDWREQDRLGVVVSTPLGALGASLLIQLVTAAYYDARPDRRAAPHYAEIYIFHLGGRFGDFSALDITPPRKEVFVDNDPVALVEAMNDRAISHIALPDVAAAALSYPWTEAETMRDRVRHCYAYSESGTSIGGDVVISTSDAGPLSDVELILEPERLLANMVGYAKLATGAGRSFSFRVARQIEDRLPEVEHQDRIRARAFRTTLTESGVTLETYRRIDIDTALQMMHA